MSRKESKYLNSLWSCSMSTTWNVSWYPCCLEERTNAVIFEFTEKKILK